MQSPELPPSLVAYRPVLNVDSDSIEQVKSLAGQWGLNSKHIDNEWRVPLLHAGELRAFYQNHDMVPSPEYIDNLREFCEDSAPTTASTPLQMPAWPEHVYDHRRQSGRRVYMRELATLGQPVPEVVEERNIYKGLVESYGDDFGPLEDGWIPVSYECEVYIIKSRRKLQEKSALRRFMRALRGANILPHMLEIGEVHIQTIEGSGHD